MRLGRIDILGSLNSLRRNLERPGKNQRDWKPDDDEKNNQSDRPVWNIEHWKNLRDSLRERPTGDDVGNRDFVNVAPLQLGKEVLRVHFKGVAGSFGASDATIASKRGLFRSESQTGESLSSP